MGEMVEKDWREVVEDRNWSKEGGQTQGHTKDPSLADVRVVVHEVGVRGGHGVLL